MNFQILGTGSSHPSRSVTNDELAALVETSDEWIRTRTGIHSRYVSTGETMSDLTAEAALRALENAGTDASELDLILCSTIRGDYLTPSQACMIQQRIGASCPALDINAACSGFLYALDVAAGYFARGRVKKVLVVSAEMLSELVDWTDRATCVLFGDGAGAVVLGEGDSLLSIKLSAQGNPDPLYARNVTSNSPFWDQPHSDCYLHMNGQEVYRFAVSAMYNDVTEVVSQAGLTLDDVTYVLPHQANIRIVETGRKKLGLPPEKVLTNIETHGNISSACIPTLMDEQNRKGVFQRGDILVLCAFGAGFTTGACVLKW